ncbi:unnamed protein product [Amoebophrya sp. A120]|nr:unnamed protein product [Amoebophrya sp. A120]|eukprot:GSA120T00018004001.1
MAASGPASNPTFMVQKQIRDNAKSMQNFMDDIYHWSESMAKEEKARDYLRKNPESRNKQKGSSSASGASSTPSTQPSQGAPPPVRGRTVLPPAGTSKRSTTSELKGGNAKNASATSSSSTTTESITKGVVERSEDNLELARDTTSLPQYYKNWNKYDVEKEIEKLEEPKQAKEFNVEEYVQQKRTTAARPNVKVAVRTAARATTAVEFSTAKKEEANRLFGKARFKEAEAAYKVALTYVMRGENEEEKDVQAVLHSNIAICRLKMQDYSGTIEASDAALSVRPDNVKAIFRRGSAYMHQQQWKRAAADLRRALELDPKDAKCRTELTYVERMLRETVEKARAHAKALMQDASRKPVLQQTPLQITERAEKKKKPSSSASSSSKNTGEIYASASATETDETGAGGGKPQAQQQQSLFISSHSAEDGNTDANGKYIPKSVRMGRQLGQQGGGAVSSSSSAGIGRQHTAAEAEEAAATRSSSLQPPTTTASRTSGVGRTAAGAATETGAATGSNSKHADMFRSNFYAFERDWRTCGRLGSATQAVGKRFSLLERTQVFSDSFTAELVLEVVDVVQSLEAHFPAYLQKFNKSAADGNNMLADGVIFSSAEDYRARKASVVAKLEAINRWPLLLQSMGTSERRKLEVVLYQNTYLEMVAEPAPSASPKAKSGSSITTEKFAVATMKSTTLNEVENSSTTGGQWSTDVCSDDPTWLEVRSSSQDVQPPKSRKAKRKPNPADLDDLD